jgi:hypothetical protein
MWRRCCRGRRDWEAYDEEDLVAASAKRMMRRESLRHALEVDEEPKPMAGPHTTLFTYLESRMSQARTAGVSYVAVARTDMDQAVGYRVPESVLQDVATLIGGRHKPVAVMYDPRGNDPYVIDWRAEDMALLTNPERSGEPEDTGHS